MKVTLTFDNGPDPDATPFVLDALAAAGASATFFVLGGKLAQPERRRLAERARDEGHWIGNHTWSHGTPLGLDPRPDAVAREIDATERALGELAHPDRLFRPFGRGGALGPHLLSRAAVDCLRAGGFTCVLWNSIPRDWDDPDGWVARALADCAAQDWTVLVLHDLPTGAMRHLPGFLDALRTRGAEIVQDFPPACLVTRRGEPLPGWERYVTPPPAATPA